MIKLDAPKGLGDAIYLRAVALHFLERGEQVTVFTPWSDVFSDLRVTVRPRSERLDPTTRRVAFPPLPTPGGVDEFRARCAYAGIAEEVRLRLGWKIKDVGLVDRVRRAARGRPILVFHSIRVVHNAVQDLLTPRREAFNRYLAGRSDCFRVRLGHPPFVIDDPDAPRDVDLYGETSIHGEFDVASVADEFFSQPSSVNCLGEAVGKRVTCMFSRRAAESDSWARYFTPERVFYDQRLATAVYDS